MIEARGFFAIERAGAATAEYGDLVAAFVHGAIAVNSLRDCQRRAAPCGTWRSAWEWDAG